MHEVVTLQFGQRVNYLATHFWNIQVSSLCLCPGSTSVYLFNLFDVY